VTDEDRVVQVKGLDEVGQVVGVGVQVVAVPRLARSAAATAVVRDGPVAAGCDQEQLVIPSVGGERPAVAEQDRLAAAPVLVENLGAVRGGDGSHQISPWFVGDWIYWSASQLPWNPSGIRAGR